LINVFEQVENIDIPLKDDDYAVKVRLKDESTFAFSPRRFAYNEKLQIREITDDLLFRNIIKVSTSYCARVVPVKKKNGTLRLCIDLLNERVMKQKYPFPIIEDCLTHLGSKSIFTLLDLKDGFHQVKIYPDYTKYFFLRPQTNICLPFDFCEAPTDFQKRLVMILNSFIRQGKVIVYIDDILIPSSTIQDNLNTLKEVLIELKRYDFQFNLDRSVRF